MIFIVESLDDINKSKLLDEIRFYREAYQSLCGQLEYSLQTFEMNRDNIQVKKHVFIVNSKNASIQLSMMKVFLIFWQCRLCFKRLFSFRNWEKKMTICSQSINYKLDIQNAATAISKKGNNKSLGVRRKSIYEKW